jgi:dethiobiotin synthetase
VTKGFFITGTDTGVGKTIVSAALIRALTMLGVKAAGMKPVETGCAMTGGVPVPSDGLLLKEAANMEEDIRLVTPYALEHPLAPLAASELEGVVIEPSFIRESFESILKKYDAVVVEGVGGLLVPLKKDYSVLDMANDFALPLIVVSRPGLGTLNHTLLAVEYALLKGLSVAGIIINHSHPPDGGLAEETNPGLLRRLSPVPVIAIFPYLKEKSITELERAVSRSLNFSILKANLFD